MVFNRLCDPDSKLGVLRWVETVTLPGIMAEKIEHHQLLRAMDAMVAHQEEVDQVLAGLLRPLLIASGYEDGNDCNTLRHDPVYRLDVGHKPFHTFFLAMKMRGIPCIYNKKNSQSEIFPINNTLLLSFVQEYQ